MANTSDDSVSAFHEAVQHLAGFAPPNLLPRGGNFGVAIAVLLHRTDPERFLISGSGPATSTHDLQVKVCDPTWSKADKFLPPGAEGPIYKPFTQSFKGESPSTNNWRNSFDLQTGIGCSAPFSPTYLQSTEFIAEHRFDCAFRAPDNGQCGATVNGANCFNPAKRGNGLPAWSGTGARHTPKLLRRGDDETGAFGYWSVEPTASGLTDLLGDVALRVPAKSFATALFSGSPYWSQWGDDHSASRLQHLLALDDKQFFTLFEGPSVINASHSGTGEQLVPGTPAAVETATPEASGGTSPGWIGTPIDYTHRDIDVVIAQAGRESDPERRRRLLESATRGHRRVLNVLASLLTEQGFEVSEQTGGYDLLASAGSDRHILFEAKTWTAANLASQVRSGWAQLEEYAYRNRDRVGSAPELALVLNHEPPSDFWAWDWFKHRNSPYVIWLAGSQLTTFSHHAHWLESVVGGGTFTSVE